MLAALRREHTRWVPREKSLCWLASSGSPAKAVLPTPTKLHVRKRERPLDLRPAVSGFGAPSRVHAVLFEGLALPLVRAFALYVGAFAAALAVSTLRLRDLALGSAPLTLWLPFIRPLFSAAFEAALLLGMPVAWLSAWTHTGAARTLGPYTKRLLLFGLLLSAVSASGAVLTDVGSRSPGLLAQQLIEAARATCELSETRNVEVPLVAVAWACPLGGKPVVSGKAPGLGVNFRAQSLEVSQDLRKVELTGVALELPKGAGKLNARIAAERARIRGLAPWGRPRHMSLGARLLFAAFGAFVTVAVAVRSFGGRREARFALPVGALCGVLLIATRALLDRWEAAAIVYAALGPVAALTVFGLALVLRVVPARWWRS